MNPLTLILWILGGILLLILLLILFGSARIRIVCREKVRVVLYVCGIPITMVSDKPKKKDLPKELKDCNNPEAILRREKRRLQKAEKKAAKKEEKKKQKAALKAQKKKQRQKQHQEGKKKQKDPSKPTLSENLSMIVALLKKLYQVTNGKFRLRVYRLHILVGTDDAAKTAILYGATVQSVSYILQWLQTHFIPIRRRPGAMTIDADFVSGKTSADIDLCCSIKFRRAIVMAVRMLMAFLKEKDAVDKKVKARLAEAKKIATSQQENLISTT